MKSSLQANGIKGNLLDASLTVSLRVLQQVEIYCMPYSEQPCRKLYSLPALHVSVYTSLYVLFIIQIVAKEWSFQLSHTNIKQWLQMMARGSPYWQGNQDCLQIQLSWYNQVAIINTIDQRVVFQLFSDWLLTLFTSYSKTSLTSVLISSIYKIFSLALLENHGGSWGEVYGPKLRNTGLED